jgi:PrtD family type I secretion system ABC transporter
MTASREGKLAPELRGAIAACRKGIVGVALVSGLINLLMLTGPLFMLQIYDRVLPSRSVPTLVGLSLLALVMFMFYGILEALRARVLVRIGRALDEILNGRVFDVIMRAPLQPQPSVQGLQSLRDLDTVRSFLSSWGLTAFFDLPWTPIYILVCFTFHSWLGWAVVAGALLLCWVATHAESATRAVSHEALSLAGVRRELAEATHRNCAVVQALGQRQQHAHKWSNYNDSYLGKQQRIYDRVGGFSSLTRALRMILQAAVLGLGSYLVIQQEATNGIILAATILTARALAPVELAIANWNAFVAARQSWARLSDAFKAVPAAQDRLPIPPPSKSLRLTAVSLSLPETAITVLHDVSFSLPAGSALGVIGPTGSGKSSLARAIVGVWKPSRGVIRLDGATLDQWPSAALGKFIGYLPQEAELFSGTVAQNIIRFVEKADTAGLIAAAKAAGVHEMVLRLPNGYETQVGPGGTLLSGGQRQRIALARALYGNPFLIVLDEPNSNLDAPGEQALTRAILDIRARGGIAIVVAHRPNAIAAVDHILVLNEGCVHAFGPKERIIAPAVAAPPPAGVSDLTRRAVPG